MNESPNPDFDAAIANIRSTIASGNFSPEGATHLLNQALEASPNADSPESIVCALFLDCSTESIKENTEKFYDYLSPNLDTKKVHNTLTWMAFTLQFNGLFLNHNTAFLHRINAQKEVKKWNYLMLKLQIFLKRLQIYFYKKLAKIMGSLRKFKRHRSNP